MSTKRIETGLQLSTLIDKTIAESLKSKLSRKRLEEKEKQESFTQRPRTSPSVLDEDDESTDLFSDDGSDGGDQQTTSGSSGKSPDEGDKLKSGEIAADDIIDRLNAIRSGKSFKDDKISAQMDEYVNGLKKPEKVALLAFLKGISQIVTGEFEGSTAVEPDSHPADVKMKKAQAGDSKQSKHVEPNVIKGVPQEKKPKSSTEDTSSPAPIVAKKK